MPFNAEYFNIEFSCFDLQPVTCIHHNVDIKTQGSISFHLFCDQTYVRIVKHRDMHKVDKNVYRPRPVNSFL